MATLLDIARGYVAAGFSVIPIKADGSKAPTVVTWKQFQKELPTDEHLRWWFGGPGVQVCGIAIICGKVSGGLEVLDFDEPGIFELWAPEFEAERPGLLALLPQVATPRGGRHVYYRLAAAEGNQKLAEGIGRETLIETRGEGGYVLAPGSPPNCHPTGGVYTHIAGPCITQTPTIEGI